jgi:hypothetical protein
VVLAATATPRDRRRGRREPAAAALGRRGWARPRSMRTAASAPIPRSAADLWSVGDVLHVSRRARAGERLVAAPEPRRAGRLHGDGCADRTRARPAGRVLLSGPRCSTAPHRRSASPARRSSPSSTPRRWRQGYGPDTMILDAPIVVDQGTGELWKPQELLGHASYGPAPMRIGLEMSRNLMTIRLAQEIGMDRVAEATPSASASMTTCLHLLSYALGAGETTLWNLVAAYAMFANGGYRIEPTVVDRVQDRRGHTIWRHEPQRCDNCRSPASMRCRPRPAGARRRAGDRPRGRASRSSACCAAWSHAAPRARLLRRAGACRRQDRHHQRGPRRLVRRLLAARSRSGCFIGYDTPDTDGARRLSAARSARRSWRSSSVRFIATARDTGATADLYGHARRPVRKRRVRRQRRTVLIAFLAHAIEFSWPP